VTRRRWATPSGDVLPVFRALLDAGDGVWVARSALREQHVGRHEGATTRLMQRWGLRGWVEQHDVVTSGPGGVRRVEYRLTPHGRDLTSRWVAAEETRAAGPVPAEPESLL
jgi:hypothetical protein